MSEQTELARTSEQIGEDIERVLVAGDLSKLNAEQRLHYYNQVCESVGLNPLTRPLEYITLNGKLTLYARKDATDQLRKLHGVSIVELNTATVGDQFVVTVKAQDRHGRIDCEIGAVKNAGLKGDQLSNAMMKASTKAKRRVTLSLCGLGMLDESELETVPAGFTNTNGRPPFAAEQAAGAIEPDSADKMAEAYKHLCEAVKSWSGCNADSVDDYIPHVFKLAGIDANGKKSIDDYRNAYRFVKSKREEDVAFTDLVPPEEL